MDDKSRHEIITRAKISWSEQKTNMRQRAWIDQELSELGLPPMTDQESGHYALVTAPRIL